MFYSSTILTLGGNVWCYLVPFYDVILPIDHVSLTLDGVTFLHVTNVRNTCKCLHCSQTFGRISSEQWRKVWRIWSIQQLLLFHHLLCVRIEIDQIQCSELLSNNLLFVGQLWADKSLTLCTHDLTSKQWIITQQVTARADLFLNDSIFYCIMSVSVFNTSNVRLF